ncbi:MAG: FISUMP domain-containing protein [Patescibacteria group bacterium]|nr:MAG: FISUMP domain-containing protein [Patescibacteria group bacterium]
MKTNNTPTFLSSLVPTRLVLGRGAAFTLIELLVVIAIIGVLSTLVIVALGNSRASARDAKRLNDLKAMANALELYYADNNQYPASITPGQPLQANDIVYISKVPNNPTPRTDGICPDSDYTYTAIPHKPGHYQFSGCLGGSSGSFTAGPISHNTESGIINCGGPITDLDGNVYNTVQIGSQCWMKENLNTKIRPNGTCINGGGNPPCPIASVADDGLGRSCYSNTESICTTDGSLYTWAAAMDGSTTPGAQGICPTGWHVPTHDELTTLERAICTSSTCVTDFPYNASTTGYRGTDEGRKLKSERTVNGSPPPGIPTSDHPRWNYNANFGTDTSGFSALPAGYRSTAGSSFGGRSTYLHLWASLPTGGSAWSRYLFSSDARMARVTYSQAYGFSVRCLKD